MLYKYAIRPSDVDSRMYRREGYVKAGTKTEAVQRICMAQDVMPDDVEKLSKVVSNKLSGFKGKNNAG